MPEFKREPWFDDFGDTDDLLLDRRGGDATSVQIGGDHYTKQGIQPFEATYANFGYEGLQAAVYTKVNKYLTRDKGSHRQDLAKAVHVLQVQLEYYDMSVEGKDALDSLAPRFTNQPIEGNK
tara:strand:- start:98 stop:463 length:366 start_codon:yes stop_codon:yes gene_type:complete